MVDLFLIPAIMWIQRNANRREKMEKLFEIAGTSKLNGVLTFRFATGKVNVRVTKLKHHEHTDIDLVQLPQPMTKEAAVKHLISLGKGLNAVLPNGRKQEKVELTPEQIAAAKKEAKRLADNERKRNARLAAKQAKQVNPYTQIEVQ